MLSYYVSLVPPVHIPRETASVLLLPVSESGLWMKDLLFFSGDVLIHIPMMGRT